MKRIYLAGAVIGTLVPWGFFAAYFLGAGPDLPGFVRALFANPAAGGFSADVLVSILIFWIWSYRDARMHGIGAWWTVVPAGCLVGLSLALPLYLYLREDRATA